MQHDFATMAAMRGSDSSAMRTIAIIGSFKQHNKEIQALCHMLRESGVNVTTPQGESIINADHEFVRYGTDDPALSDDAVQSLALHRIFGASLVYAVLPDGYIGRTTCYEVGRVLQAKRPIYFSQRPNDLPIWVPDQFILDRATLLSHATDPTWVPEWLFKDDVNVTSTLEQELIAGKLRNA